MRIFGFLQKDLKYDFLANRGEYCLHAFNE